MRGGFFRKRNWPPRPNTKTIKLFATLLPGISPSVGTLSIRNPSGTKYTHHFFAIKLNGDEFTQFFSKGHSLI
jgi:hypothetical protein